MKNKIRVASLFSGIGGFELGFKKSKMSYNILKNAQTNIIISKTTRGQYEKVCNFNTYNMFNF